MIGLTKVQISLIWIRCFRISIKLLNLGEDRLIGMHDI